MSCDIRGGQNGIATSFSLSFFPFLLLVTAPYPPSAPLAVWHSADSEALWHILGLWAVSFISAAALGWLQRGALLNRRNKGVKEWGFTGLENRKCVSNYCHVRCNQFQPCKLDRNLHALYGQKRESLHPSPVLKPYSLHLSVVKRRPIALKWNGFAFQPFARQMLVDRLINLRILFYLLFPFLSFLCSASEMKFPSVYCRQVLYTR